MKRLIFVVDFFYRGNCLGCLNGSYATDILFSLKCHRNKTPSLLSPWDIRSQWSMDLFQQQFYSVRKKYPVDYFNQEHYFIGLLKLGQLRNNCIVFEQLSVTIEEVTVENAVLLVCLKNDICNLQKYHFRYKEIINVVFNVKIIFMIEVNLYQFIKL